MTFKQSKMALCLIALAVLASGCTDGQGGSIETSQTTALDIQTFSALPTNVFEGDRVQLEVGVKNVGGAEATNVRMRIFNIPFGGGQGSWSGTRSFDFADMQPPDPESDIPSVPKERTVNLNAPDLNENLIHTYDVRGRLLFDYETTAVTEMEVMGYERWKQVGATRSSPSADNSGGPIQLEVRTESPIVVDSSSPQFCIRVNNVGEGTPYLQGTSGDQPEDNPDAVRKVEIDISSPEVQLSPLQGGNEVDLVSGQGGKCYEFSGVGNDANIQTTVPITMEASYGYMKEASTSVTVEGQ